MDEAEIPQEREPRATGWDWLDLAVRELSSDFLAEEREKLAEQSRNALDSLFSEPLPG